jgi:hypothetical protein
MFGKFFFVVLIVIRVNGSFNFQKKNNCYDIIKWLEGRHGCIDSPEHSRLRLIHS